jgi:hypothetical protein
MVKRGYRLRLERKALDLAPAGAGDKQMIDEIKLDISTTSVPTGISDVPSPRAVT